MQSFVERAREVIGFDLNPHQLHDFKKYASALVEWNERINLTSITDPEQIENKHFLDSLSLIPFIREFSIRELIDIGTGAGFPGIPLKIAIPELKITLVESIRKKTDFCQELIRKLDLQEVTVIQCRAEELGQDSHFRERFDLGVARAVAQLDILAEYILPIIRLGGRMLAQKGRSGPEEVQKGEHAIRILGGSVKKLVPVMIPGICEERFIIIIDKVASTPSKYPRRVGIPLKRRIRKSENKPKGIIE